MKDHILTHRIHCLRWIYRLRAGEIFRTFQLRETLMNESLIDFIFAWIFSSVTSLSNMPLRKTHGSVSSNDSGHSDALSFCEQPNVYHLTATMHHNVQNPAVPLPPRRHSAVQQGSSGSNNIYSTQLISPNSSSTKQANGDISSMPPPPIPRSRPVPYPVAVPVIPGSNPNVSGYNIHSSQQQQYQQMRHAGEFR